MFIQNKYSKWYNQIVLRAQHRITKGYTEKHHVIPKSLGGTDKKENLADLTAREHFICHLLLPKFTTDKDKQKMQYALWMMMHIQNEHQQERYRINSHYYLILKENLSKVFSKQHKGRKLSEEHKRKISITRKRRIKSGQIKVNESKEKYKLMSKRMQGHKHSIETKKKIGLAHKGKIISEEQRLKLSEANLGNAHTAEAKVKISETMKEQYATGARVAWNKGRKWRKGVKNI